MVKYYQKILSAYVVEYYHILPKSDVHYFKLPYIGNLSHHIKNKLSKLCKEICKENFNIKLVFNSFKVQNSFSKLVQNYLS